MKGRERGRGTTLKNKPKFSCIYYTFGEVFQKGTVRHFSMIFYFSTHFFEVILVLTYAKRLRDTAL